MKADNIAFNKKNLYRQNISHSSGVVDLRNAKTERERKIENVEVEKEIFAEAAEIEKETIKSPLLRGGWGCVNSAKKPTPSPSREGNNNLNEMIRRSFLSDRGVSQYAHTLKQIKGSTAFTLAALGLLLIIPAASFIQKEVDQKGKVLGVSIGGYQNLKNAEQSILAADLEKSGADFQQAARDFSSARDQIESANLGIWKIIGDLPVETPVSAAQNLLAAGENISLAGECFARVLDNFSELNLPSRGGSRPAPTIAEYSTITSALSKSQSDIDQAVFYLEKTNEHIQKINSSYFPKETEAKIENLKITLPILTGALKSFSEDIPVLLKVLGHERSQKYLLLFQNNQEIRATGGFIGSYGVIDIEGGEIKNIFVEGIFNIDGQLNEKIIPPRPIQKISTAWSMHDANWFADFPTSARKVAGFYEKTGGPTVDGVIALTPNVIQKLLVLTGPIAMPEYNVTIDAGNFINETQKQVEELYDEELNQPKKILADLTPKIIEKIQRNSSDENHWLELISVIEESFHEKHLLLYSRGEEIEKAIIKRGWGGEIKSAAGDYLSVVNSNINGYKTDGVVEEKITHQAEIRPDGSIINTVKIKRIHHGGNSEYYWHNRVNSDYLRVYVPLDSQLLEAKGHTWQKYEPPVNYQSHNFKIDPDVFKLESSMTIDPNNGTHIFTESGKTVFGNWVYVSPGEEVEVSYRYKLPFKINFGDFTKPADKYSLLIQKQSGSLGSEFSSAIKYPQEWEVVFGNESYETVLDKDGFWGVVFEKVE